MPRRSVAVLGAGIMGTSVALFLARQGFDVSLVDRESAPVAATSRWNEGKIHLGYLYGADATLRTARHVLPGGLRFGPLLAELIESDLRAHTTTSDDTYLVHRDSVVNADSVRAQFEAVSELVRNHPDASSYLVDVRSARATALSPTELRRIASDDVMAGWRVPERSVNTRWVADRLAEAVGAANRVVFRPLTTVVDVAPVDSIHDRWRVRGSGGFDETFDVVVNALWNGRLPIDVTAGITPQGPWSHRYRLAVFVRTSEEVDVPSAIVAVGPFGDIKNYNGRDFYVNVEKLVEPLRAHPRAVLAFTDVDLYDVDGTSSRCVFRALDGMRSRFLRGLVMATYPTNWWVPNRGLFRASAFRDIGGIHPNEQGEYSADWTWLLALALRGEFVRVPEALCEKYFKPNSLSKNWPIEGVKAGALRRAGEAEIQRSPLNLVGTLVLIALLRLPRFMPPSVKKIARGLAGRRGRATRQTRS